MFDVFDPVIAGIIKSDIERNNCYANLIASENYPSPNVLHASGTHLTYKYAEGFPGARYYQGCVDVDAIENEANSRLAKLFGVNHADTQSHSGSQANLAALSALLKPGDVFLGLHLDHGGHLTHGAHVSLTSKFFNPVHYTVTPDKNLIDMNQVEDLVREHRPKLIIAGASAYSRVISFKNFSMIAKKYGAYLMADIAHIAGLVATGVHESPVECADIITSTTHKTLRGPRGGVFMSNNEEVFKKVRRTLFPGSQGGPCMHTIAAKAVAFKEALEPSFKSYIQQLVANAYCMATFFKKHGIKLVADGTDNHLFMFDLSDESFTGKEFTTALEACHIIANANTVPYDKRGFPLSSGARFGTASITTRGLKNAECTVLAGVMVEVYSILRNDPKADLSDSKYEALRNSVKDLMLRYRVYG